MNPRLLELLAGSSSNDTTPPGQTAYYTAGTYSWVAPSGITSVSVVCLGAGGSNGGGGGELRYKNNITVVPGNSYTVVVGQVPSFVGSNTQSNGGASSFNSTTCVANGGRSGANGGTGGSGGTGDGGGNGGAAGSYGTASYFGYQVGGGGAGGYSGNGGNGGSFSGASYNGGTNGAGGGGGGGASGYDTGSASGGGAQGGGVGLLGQGANGAGAPSGAGGPGVGAPNGSNGSPSGNETTDPSWKGPGGGFQGNAGAVRIIWGGPGVTRAFPSTNTGNY